MYAREFFVEEKPLRLTQQGPLLLPLPDREGEFPASLLMQNLLFITSERFPMFNLILRAFVSIYFILSQISQIARIFLMLICAESPSALRCRAGFSQMKNVSFFLTSYPLPLALLVPRAQFA